MSIYANRKKKRDQAYLDLPDNARSTARNAPRAPSHFSPLVLIGCMNLFFDVVSGKLELFKSLCGGISVVLHYHAHVKSWAIR